MKKRSGWYRMFIVFVGLWTILSIWVLMSSISENYEVMKRAKEKVLNVEDTKTERFVALEKKLQGKPLTKTEQLLFLQLKESTSNCIEETYKHDLSEARRELREISRDSKNMIFIFPLYWLAPIGFVYGLGRTTGWIIRGFRKANE